MGEETPPDVCSWVFHSLFPSAQVSLHGGPFPWEQDPSKATIACADPEKAVVFELRCTSPWEIIASRLDHALSEWT